MRARSIPKLPEGGPPIPLTTREKLKLERDACEPRLQIGFLEVLFDELQQTYMVLCEIVELGLRQEVWLSIYPRRRGANDASDDPVPAASLSADLVEWVFRPAQGSGMIPSWGVQIAIDRLAQQCGYEIKT